MSKSRSAYSVSLGCLLGAAGGVLTALADFGAHVFYLEAWSDRARFLMLLLCLQAPSGALVGAGAGALLALGERATQRLCDRLRVTRAAVRDALHGLWLLLPLTPGAVAVAVLLFRGGSASRIAFRPVLQPLCAVLLLVGALAAFVVACRVLARCRRERRTAHAVFVLCLALSIALGKIDQWVLPKLYDYLHAVLTVGAFAFAVFGLLSLWTALSNERARRGIPLVGAAALGLCAAALNGAISQLDRSQNVRVALLSPRASHSRSLMQGLSPLVIQAQDRAAVERARQKASAARARRTALQVAREDAPNTTDAHVLLITVDALRADHLGTYGYARKTSPEIDALAERAVVFEQAYAPAPHSSFSLCSLMTSEYLHETVDLDTPLPRTTLARAFADAGYHTAAFFTRGIFHTAGEKLAAYDRENLGFGLADHTNLPAAQLTQRVLGEVDRTIERGEPSSFFWVHFFDVHEPYQATYFGTSALDRYDSEIREVDKAVANLIAGMHERLSRDVVVVLTADHGEEFRDHGGVYHGSTLYQEQIRVPLLIDAPGFAPEHVTAPVGTIDVAPTLLAFAGLPVPKTMRGEDLRALALGRVDEMGPAFAAVIHKKMVVRWPYKLIADLRFGLFELYDLERDPSERRNLADREPDLMTSLKGEVYAWLDSLGPKRHQTAAEIALERGRLRDRRAVLPLSRLLLDELAPVEHRIEAARILGDLADARAGSALVSAMREADRDVAAEAAIALGRLYDPRAREALRELVAARDLGIRTRAAVSLGRLRDPAAVPGLIEALHSAEGTYDREEAVRWLGRLRDPRALAPLIELLPEMRTRYLVVIAMGLIGDPRAYEPLADVLRWEQHPNIRDNVARGLGLLGDPRARRLLLELALEEPNLKYPGESLVRLGAIEGGVIGGADIAPGSHARRGLRDCVEGDPLHDWNYLHRTTCTMSSTAASLRVDVPPSVATSAGGAVALVSARRADSPEAGRLSVRIGDAQLPEVELDGSWSEVRIPILAGHLKSGSATLSVRGHGGARFVLDHVLLLPSAAQALAARADAQHAPVGPPHRSDPL